MSARSDGYLKAKREMVANIDARILKLQHQLDNWGIGPIQGAITQGQIEALESLRQYVRNNMLWSRKPGRRKK